MESQKHKESRLKDGGISSNNCKCGRPWKAKHFGSFRWIRICRGCDRPTKNCNCPHV